MPGRKAVYPQSQYADEDDDEDACQWMGSTCSRDGRHCSNKKKARYEKNERIADPGPAATPATPKSPTRERDGQHEAEQG